MFRRHRRLWMILGIIGVLLGAGYACARFYLTSDAVARMVEQNLQETLGVPVRIASIDVGLLGSTKARGVEVQEPAGGGTWLRIDELEADVSAADFLFGSGKPGKVTLRGADAVVRFDEAGNLLTGLPKTVQTKTAESKTVLQTENARLTLSQAGRPPMVVSGLNLEVTPAGDGADIEGTIDDPAWGDWTAKGTMTGNPSGGQLLLTSDRAHLVPKLLQSIPFVSPGIWTAVVLEGPTRAEVRLAFGQANNTGYCVHLQPDGISLRVPAIGLASTDTTGSAIIENAVVRLEDVRGKSAGGSIEASGKLDFNPAPWRFELDAAVAGVDLQKFTQGWSMSEEVRQLSGRLTGSAKLRLNVGDRLEVRGSGQGRVEEARVFGDWKTEGPVLLRLSTDRGGPKLSTDANQSPQAPAPARPGGAASGPPSFRGVPREVLRQFQQVQQPTPPKPPPKPLYLDLQINLADVPLEQVFERIKMPMPFPMEGRASLKAKLSVPVNAPGETAAYKLDGTLALQFLRLGDYRLEKVETAVNMDKGVLRFDRLTAEVPVGTARGRVEGSIAFEVAPARDLTATLKLSDMPLDLIARAVPALQGAIAGAASGEINLRAPISHVGDISKWIVDASVRVPRATVFGLALSDLTADAALRNGTITLSRASGKMAGVGLKADGTLQLKDKYPYRFTVRGDDLALADVARLAPPGTNLPDFTGTVSVNVIVDGTLSPAALQTSGEVSSKSITLSGIRIEDFRATWKSDGQTIRIDNATGRLYGGEATGSAILPLRAQGTGSFHVGVTGADLDLLSRSLEGFPVPLGGKPTVVISGDIGSDAGKGRTIKANAAVGPRVRVMGLPIGRVEGTFESGPEGTTYSVKATALGGQLELTGQMPANAGPILAVHSGAFHLHQARVGRLLQSFMSEGKSSLLRGLIDIDLSFRVQQQGDAPVGQGKVQVSRVRLEGTELSSRLAGNLRLAGGRLELDDFTGDLGGGTGRLRVSYHLTSPEQSWFTLGLDRVDTAKVLSPWPDIASVVKGPVSLSLRGSLGQEWRGHGDLSLGRGTVLGADVSEWRVPLRFTFSPERGSGQIDVSDSIAQAGSGRVNAQGTLGWGAGNRIDVHLRFQNVELRGLLRGTGIVEREIGAGRITGRFDLMGQDVRSAADLNGRLDVTFAQAQALQLPVLFDLLRYLPGLSASTTFQTGYARATLGRNIWRIQWLALEGSAARLFVTGTITTEGRLDLQVVARTGTLIINPILLRLVVLAGTGPLPAETISRAVEWLSNRVISLQVSGTLQNPVVRIDTLRILTEEAVRFFIRQYGLPYTLRSSQSSFP